MRQCHREPYTAPPRSSSTSTVNLRPLTRAASAGRRGRPAAPGHALCSARPMTTLLRGFVSASPASKFVKPPCGVGIGFRASKGLLVARQLDSALREHPPWPVTLHEVEVAPRMVLDEHPYYLKVREFVVVRDLPLSEAFARGRDPHRADLAVARGERAESGPNARADGIHAGRGVRRRIVRNGRDARAPREGGGRRQREGPAGVRSWRAIHQRRIRD